MASLLGYGELTLRRAERALERVMENHWTDWRLALCHERMARAPAMAGNTREWDHLVALARGVPTASTTPRTGS